MKYRYLVIALVAALVLFGTPTVLALASVSMSVPEDEDLSALVIYNEGFEEDPYTLQIINGAYDAYVENHDIEVYLLPYPAGDRKEESLSEILEYLNSTNKMYDVVVVACRENTFDVKEVAEKYPETTFVFLDSGAASQVDLPNVFCYDFLGEESAFLAGYVAGMKTNTNIVGFVAGNTSEPVDRIRYGFEAGVRYAEKDRDETIGCNVVTIDSMDSESKGKEAALELYQNGADIIMAAAGASGIGVINAAKEHDFYVIGCDVDQSYLAPDNILCSATKKVDAVVMNILKTSAESKFANMGISEGLNKYPSRLGLAGNYVAIEGKHSSLSDMEQDIEGLKDAIIKEVIPIPYSKETMKTWSVVPITENQAPIIKYRQESVA